MNVMKLWEVPLCLLFQFARHILFLLVFAFLMLLAT